MADTGFILSRGDNDAATLLRAEEIICAYAASCCSIYFQNINLCEMIQKVKARWGEGICFQKAGR